MTVPFEVSTGWQDQLRRAVRGVNELLTALDLEPDDFDDALDTSPDFPMLVPRSFVSRMRPRDPTDPLLRQVVPLQLEREEYSELSRDPLAESVFGHEGVIRKYQGRSLLITTGACAINCRYCFRRDFPYSDHALGGQRLEQALEQLVADPDLDEVILSGGDPLLLSNARLGDLLDRLEQARPDLRSVRIHTRLPIVLPDRIDLEFLRLLESRSIPVTVVVHCNHAREIDDQVAAALKALRKSASALLNQSVLLRGINDSADALADLSWSLFEAGVLPYYLHVADPVQGTGHLRVTTKEAQTLHHQVHARLPGYLVPRLVQEVPGAVGKTDVSASLLESPQGVVEEARP